MAGNSRYISAETLCREVLPDLNRSTVYKWVRRTSIPHYKIGKRVLFDPEEVRRWMDGHKVEPYDPQAIAHQIRRSG